MTAIQKETPAALWLATLDEPDAATRVSHGELRGFNSVVWTRDGHIVYSARSGEYRNIWITDAAGEIRGRLATRAQIETRSRNEMASLITL